MRVFEENFQDNVMNSNIWKINKVGFITGYTVPIMEVYHITDAKVALIQESGSKGNQHEARTDIPDNCDINFSITFSDPNPTASGQMGIGIVKRGIDGLDKPDDDDILLFVGCQDVNSIGASPEKVVIAPNTSLGFIDHSWYQDHYIGGVGYTKMTKAISDTLIESNSFRIEKRGNNYTVYSNDVPVCNTSFDEKIRLSIIASTTDPCLYFVDYAEIHSITIDSVEV